MARFEFTRRATIALVITPTALSSLFALLAVLAGVPIGSVVVGTLIGIAAWIAVASPFVLLLGFTKDAVVEGKRYSEVRRVIRSRRKHPVAGAMSVIDDRTEGALSETPDDRGAVSPLPPADNHPNVRS